MTGRRPLFAVVGLLATGLAILGVWLPGLPTTPFVLVALWAFSQSSVRLSTWLRRVPILRGAIAAADRYRQERTLPRNVKIIAQSAAWGSVPVVLLLTRSSWIMLAVAAAAVACSVFMASTPTRGAQEASALPRAEVRTGLHRI